MTKRVQYTGSLSVVGERGRTKRGSPQRPQQLGSKRRPVLCGQHSRAEDHAEPAGERQAYEHQSSRRHQDGYQRSRDDSEGDGDPLAAQKRDLSREDLTPALKQPKREDRAADRQRRQRSPGPPQADLLAFVEELL
jgi:hypothetical protein